MFIFLSMSKIFIFIVAKPNVFLTPLIVTKFVLFNLFVFSFFKFINLELMRETLEPESYIPNVSNWSFNKSLTLINGVIIRFLVPHNLILHLLSY